MDTFHSYPLSLRELIGSYETPEDLPANLRTYYDRAKLEGKPYRTRSEMEEDSSHVPNPWIPKTDEEVDRKFKELYSDPLAFIGFNAFYQLERLHGKSVEEAYEQALLWFLRTIGEEK